MSRGERPKGAAKGKQPNAEALRPPPPPPGPPPKTKVIIVGENKIDNRENLVRPFLVHNFLGPRPPPPLFSCSPAQQPPLQAQPECAPVTVVHWSLEIAPALCLCLYMPPSHLPTPLDRQGRAVLPGAQPQEPRAVQQVPGDGREGAARWRALRGAARELQVLQHGSGAARAPGPPWSRRLVPGPFGGGWAERSGGGGMAWPANPVATGCQGNPCSTGIRWGVSPAAQMGCLRNRSGSPSGAGQP